LVATVDEGVVELAIHSKVVGDESDVVLQFWCLPFDADVLLQFLSDLSKDILNGAVLWLIRRTIDQLKVVVGGAILNHVLDKRRLVGIQVVAEDDTSVVDATWCRMLLQLREHVIKKVASVYCCGSCNWTHKEPAAWALSAAINVGQKSWITWFDCHDDGDFGVFCVVANLADADGAVRMPN